jgi:RimJ/RimL family protein N-acetyltransferase
MLTQAPLLETERLVLRAWRKDDFASYCAIVGDSEVMRHFSGPIASKEDSWRRLAASVGSWPLLGLGGWAVALKLGGELVGMVSLFNGWRALEPVFGEEPEMGWIFAKEVHGQGMAGEACRAVLAWADSSLQPTPIWAIVAPTNQPSFKLAERLGFERLGDTIYNDETTAVLRRPPRA